MALPLRVACTLLGPDTLRCAAFFLLLALRLRGFRRPLRRGGCALGFFFTVAVAASASYNVCAHAASPRSVSCVIGMVCGGTFFRFAASPKLFVEYLPPLPPGLLRPTFVRDRSPCVSRSYQAFPSPPAAPRALRPLRERAQRAQLQHLRQSSQRACFRTPRRVS